MDFIHVYVTIIVLSILTVGMNKCVNQEKSETETVPFMEQEGNGPIDLRRLGQ